MTQLAEFAAGGDTTGPAELPPAAPEKAVPPPDTPPAETIRVADASY